MILLLQLVKPSEPGFLRRGLHVRLPHTLLRDGWRPRDQHRVLRGLHFSGAPEHFHEIRAPVLTVLALV